MIPEEKDYDKFENETHISFNDLEKEAHIFTCSRKWQAHLEKKLGLKPSTVNEDGSKIYDLPKSCVAMPRLPKRLSAEARANLSKRLGEQRRAGRLTRKTLVTTA